MSISIVFEGVEGAGKSTQAKLLKLVLEKVCDFPILQVREPGGTNLGVVVREILLGGDFKNMDASSRSLLYTAARNELMKKVVFPFLKENPNGIVIGDRSWPSTLALQTSDGDTKDYVYELNKPFIDVYPTNVFYVDIPPQEIKARLLLASENGREINWRDTQNFEKFVQERRNYLDLVGKYRDRFVLVDGLYEPWDITIRAAGLTLDLLGQSGDIKEAKMKLRAERGSIEEYIKLQFNANDFARLEQIRKQFGVEEVHELRREMYREWRDLGFGEQIGKGIERI